NLAGVTWPSAVPSKSRSSRGQEVQVRSRVRYDGVRGLLPAELPHLQAAVRRPGEAQPQEVLQHLPEAPASQGAQEVALWRARSPRPPRGVAPTGRATDSKSVGSGFESLHP